MLQFAKAWRTCGIVIPSGIYTDQGAKGLRELLFEKNTVTGLFCFENRKSIFENVDSRFKFVVLSFRKSGNTQKFPAAFMRHDVKELAQFPKEIGMEISVEMIKRLSPDTWSVMEFKCPTDVQIAEKMARFPPLGEKIEGVWNLKLAREFDMTNDSHLFRTTPAPGRLPLYEGKMIHQFDHDFGKPKYWVDEAEGRKAVLGRTADVGQVLPYQTFRIGVRAIASNTNERTVICGPIPPYVFVGNSVLVSCDASPSLARLVALTFLNSFAVDNFIRQSVSANINQFYIYQIPVPRLTPDSPFYWPIVTRAAKLVCTSPEFEPLWNEVAKELNALPSNSPKPISDPFAQPLEMPKSPPLGATASAEQSNALPSDSKLPTFDSFARSLEMPRWTPECGSKDPDYRIQLRAELDAIIAHIYGLTEEEFIHVLSAFPIVKENIKSSTLTAYRALANRK